MLKLYRSLFLLFTLCSFAEGKEYLLPQKFEDNSSYMLEKSSWKIKNPEYYHRYIRFKKIFDESIVKLNENKKNNKLPIPKIIHHVWPGNESDKIPVKFLYHIKKCQLIHPNWQHKIWYEEDIIKENFTSLDLYKNAKSYAERADIMRYEILYKYGGVYLDTDVDCIKPLDQIVENFSVWLNSEPGEPLVFNGVMASYKNNSLFSDTINIIRNDYEENTKQVINKYHGKRNLLLLNHTLAYYRTLKPLSKAFDINSYDDGSTLLLPSRYAVSEKLRSNNFEGIWEKIQQKLFFLSEERLFVPDYVLVHHAARISGGNSYMLSPKLRFSMIENFSPFSSWWDYKNIKNTEFKDVVNFLYNKNYPEKKTFSVANTIQPNIFLFNLSEANAQIWKSNLPWIKFTTVKEENYNKIISDQRIKISHNNNVNNFLAALITVYNNGGVAVSGDLVPKFNFIWELFYKYHRFFVLAPLEKDLNLRVSPLIFGGSQKDEVIGRVIEKLRLLKEVDMKTISKIISEDLVHNISFINANSSTIVFPAVNFFGNDKRNMSFTYEK